MSFKLFSSGYKQVSSTYSSIQPPPPPPTRDWGGGDCLIEPLGKLRSVITKPELARKNVEGLLVWNMDFEFTLSQQKKISTHRPVFFSQLGQCLTSVIHIFFLKFNQRALT